MLGPRNLLTRGPLGDDRSHGVVELAEVERSRVADLERRQIGQRVAEQLPLAPRRVLEERGSAVREGEPVGVVGVEEGPAFVLQRRPRAGRHLGARDRNDLDLGPAPRRHQVDLGDGDVGGVADVACEPFHRDVDAELVADEVSGPPRPASDGATVV
jgi:hypothetical protein